MPVEELKIAGKVEISENMKAMASHLRTIANEIERGECNAVAYAAVYVPVDETIHRLHSTNFVSENAATFSLMGAVSLLGARINRDYMDSVDGD